MGETIRVWCLRHAESENVVDGAAGVLESAPLTARGREQALAAARTLASEPITRIYTSTAARAIQTAAPIAAESNGNARRLSESVRGLAEFGIGRAEGSRDPEIRRRTAQVLRAWVVDSDLDQRIDDGETGHEVVTRMSAVFASIAAEHPGETVAIVGHVGSLTVALSRLCGLGPAVWGTPLPHAEPFLVEWDGQAWRCPAWPVSPPRSAP